MERFGHNWIWRNGDEKEENRYVTNGGSTGISCLSTGDHVNQKKTVVLGCEILPDMPRRWFPTRLAALAQQAAWISAFVSTVASTV